MTELDRAYGNLLLACAKECGPAQWERKGYAELVDEMAELAIEGVSKRPNLTIHVEGPFQIIIKPKPEEEEEG